MTPDAASESVAERVVVSYAPATENVQRELGSSRWTAYLRRVESGPVEEGDEWEQFVSRGCGSTRDVVLTVESVTGGDRVDDRTDFEFVPVETDGESGETDESGGE